MTIGGGTQKYMQGGVWTSRDLRRMGLRVGLHGFQKGSCFIEADAQEPGGPSGFYIFSVR